MALILVTGASTGLGLATVTSLADQGHDVVLHARSVERMRDHSVLSRMSDVVYGDLSNLEASVLVAESANAIGVFDAVIHNAGVLRGPEVLAVNLVAPYVLSVLMVPRRSIYLSSSMHFSGSRDLGAEDLLRSPGRPRAYDDSKLYGTTLTMALATRHPDKLSHAVDPGWVPTRMGGAGAPDSLAAGHETQEWLATADAAELAPRSGGYWHHRTARRPHPATQDREFQGELIDLLESATGIRMSTSSEVPSR